jgi:hypothetical protein
MIILIFFLDGLPLGYDSIKFLLLAQENLTHGVVLSRLQQQESMTRVASNENGSIYNTSHEMASQASEQKCYNCDKPGHFAREYRLPKRERDTKSRNSGNSQDLGYKEGYLS